MLGFMDTQLGTVAGEVPRGSFQLKGFKASKVVVKESWAVLQKDKEIMGFTVLSAICTLLALTVMAILYYFLILHGSSTAFYYDKTQHVNVFIQYGTLLMYYVVIYFITNFFQAGLFTIVQGRFEGKDLNFNDGLAGAKKNLAKIFLWSLIAATVGMILQIISDKAKIVGKIVSSLLGAAWNILTYFSLPALVIGNSSVKESFKTSAAMIRKTWGEAIIVNFGVGTVFGLIAFAVIAFSVGVIVLLPSMFTSIAVGAFLAIALVVLIVISSTLSAIFKLALFNYARTGQVPSVFSADLVKAAIKVKP